MKRSLMIKMIRTICRTRLSCPVMNLRRLKCNLMHVWKRIQLTAELPKAKITDSSVCSGATLVTFQLRDSPSNIKQSSRGRSHTLMNLQFIEFGNDQNPVYRNAAESLTDRPAWSCANCCWWISATGVRGQEWSLMGTPSPHMHAHVHAHVHTKPF